MANAGSINYEFTASVANLEQQAVVAQKIIEDKIGKQIDSIGTKSTVSDKKIVTMMKNMAREGRAVSPMLGKIGVAIAGIDAVVVPLYRSFETFFARLQPKLEAFGMSLLSKLTTPLGLVAAGFTAVAAAAWAFDTFLSEGAQRARAYSEALEAIKKEQEEIRKSEARSVLAATLDGDLKARLKAQATAARASMMSNAERLQQLGGFSADAVDASIKRGRGLPRPKMTEDEAAMDEYQARMQRMVNPGFQSQGDAIKQQEDLLAEAKKYYLALQMYEKQLSEIAEMEKTLSDIQSEKADAITSNAAAAEKAASDALKDQEKLAAAAEKASERELAAQDRLAEKANERAQAEAERAAQEQAQHEARLNMVELEKAQVQQSQYAFYEWAASLQANMADVYNGIQSMVQMAVQGIGDAFARTIVYGESLGEAMDALWKQMAASAISMLLQVAVQQLIILALVNLGVVAAGSARLAIEFAVGAAAMMASVFAAVPFPANLWMAPVMAATAVGMMSGAATAAGVVGAGVGAKVGGGGILGLAEGGLVTGAMLALVGEGGQDELIAPRSDYERLFESARGGGDIAIYLDGQELTRSVAKRLPGELRKHGVR